MDAIDFRVWLGFFAPPGTAAPIVETVRAAVRDALKDEAVRQRLETAAIEPTFGTAEQLTAILERQSTLLIQALAASTAKPR